MFSLISSRDTRLDSFTEHFLQRSDLLRRTEPKKAVEQELRKEEVRKTTCSLMRVTAPFCYLVLILIIIGPTLAHS